MLVSIVTMLLTTIPSLVKVGSRYYVGMSGIAHTSIGMVCAMC
jgi:hypothetical protein